MNVPSTTTQHLHVSGRIRFHHQRLSQWALPFTSPITSLHTLGYLDAAGKKQRREPFELTEKLTISTSLPLWLWVSTKGLLKFSDVYADPLAHPDTLHVEGVFRNTKFLPIATDQHEVDSDSSR